MLIFLGTFRSIPRFNHLVQTLNIEISVMMSYKWKTKCGFYHFIKTTLSFTQNLKIRIISRTIFSYHKLCTFSVFQCPLALPIDIEMLSSAKLKKRKKKRKRQKAAEDQHPGLFLTKHIHV